MTYQYSIHGLTVESPFEIAGLRAGSAGPDGADVEIELGTAPVALAPPIAFAEDYQVAGEEILLNVRGVARFWSRSGRTLVIDRYPGSHMNDVLVYLLGSGLAAILHQRGHFPLHASAFVRGEECIGFMGDSGAGKSTLVAMLSQRGFKLLSDDVLVTVPAEGGGLLALPSSTALKLTPQSMAAAGVEKPRQEDFDSSDQAKVRFVAAARFAERPARLAALYRLRWLLPASAAPEIVPLPQFEALTVLRQNTYRPALIDAMGQEARFLAFAGEALRGLKFFEFRRALNFEQAPVQLGALLGHVGDFRG